MKAVYFRQGTGLPYMVTTVPEGATPEEREGYILNLVDDTAEVERLYRSGGVVKICPIAPGPNYRFDVLTERWVKDAAALEPLAKEVRRERDLRLQASDWTQSADAPLTTAKKAEWKTYRDSLRDVPNQSGFPEKVLWPTPPT